MGDLLNIEMKGSRNYVHSTDLFDKISGLLVDRLNGYIKKLAMRAFFKNKPIFSFVKMTDYRLVADGIFFSTDSGKEMNFYIYDSGLACETSYSFDEADLSYFFNNDESCITCVYDKVMSWSKIDFVIILNKFFCYDLLDPVFGKWVFVQIDLESDMPHDIGVIKICNPKAVASRFMITELYLDDIYYGKIRFAVGEL